MFDKAISLVHSSIMSLNNSRFFAGLVMIMLNIGSKYISVNLSKNQEYYLRNYIGRVVLLFAISWMGTRDIYSSIVLTSAFIVMTEYLFNEDSKFCVLPSYLKQFNEVLDQDEDNVVSEEEIQRAVKILEKANEMERKRQQLQLVNAFK